MYKPNDLSAINADGVTRTMTGPNSYTAPVGKQGLTPGSVLTLAAAFSSTWTSVRVAGFGVADLLLAIALVVVMLENVLRMRRIVVQWWMAAPTLAVLLVWTVGEVSDAGRGQIEQLLATSVFASLSAEVEPGYLFVLRMVIATLVVSLVASSEVDTFGRAGAIRLIGAWTLGAGVSAVIAVTDAIGATSVGATLAPANSLSTRALGLAFHPNSLSQTVVLTIPFAIWFCAASRKRWSRFGWILLSVSGISALLLADSRGGLVVGLLSAVTSVAVLLVRSHRFPLLPLVLLVPGLVGTWLAAGWLLENTRLAGSGGAQLSDEGRSFLIDVGFRAFISNPLFGAGIGNGAGVMVPLVLLSSGGVVLLIGYYVLILGALQNVLPQRGDVFIAICLVSITALLAMGFLNNSIHERYNFFALVAAATLATLMRGPQAESHIRADTFDEHNRGPA